MPRRVAVPPIEVQVIDVDKIKAAAAAFAAAALQPQITAATDVANGADAKAEQSKTATTALYNTLSENGLNDEQRSAYELSITASLSAGAQTMQDGLAQTKSDLAQTKDDLALKVASDSLMFANYNAAITKLAVNGVKLDGALSAATTVLVAIP